MALIGLKHYRLKCEKRMNRWRAFEHVWSELLKNDQSGHPNLRKAPNYDVDQILTFSKAGLKLLIEKQ